MASRSGPFPFEDIFFKSEDGVQLHGRLFLAQKPAKGTIIQFHDHSKNLTAHYLNLAWLTTHGHNLFIFDYRGYGQSEWYPSPEGIRLDALSALHGAVQIHQIHSPKGTLIVVGQALGGAVALKAVEDFPDNHLIDLVVLDSAFASYQKLAFKKWSSHWLTWALSPLAYVLVSDAVSANLRLFKHPLLVIHSENDPVIPFACGKSIYDQVASPRKFFWKGQEVEHLAGFSSRERQKHFIEFLGDIY